MKNKVVNLEVWKKRLQTTATGNVVCNHTNIVAAIEHAPELNGCIAYDTFRNQFLVMRELPWADADRIKTPWVSGDMTELLLWLQDNGIPVTSIRTVQEAVAAVAKRKTFNPLQDYLGELQWDGRRRIGSWLIDYLGAEDTEYMRIIGPKFLISAVARGQEPGCQVDTALVLEGDQGIFKSSAVATLAGRDWFTDDVGDLSKPKEVAIQLQGRWVLEISEMASFKTATIEKVKAHISRRTDRFRPPYGATAEDFDRQCVMVITTNDSTYLKDVTGNRRFWPVLCTNIDIVGLERDRDQLWAEAVHCHHQGESWWLGGDEARLAVIETDQRMEAEVWEDVVYQWLESRPNSEVTTHQVLSDAVGKPTEQRSYRDAVSITKIMTKLGWTDRQVTRMVPDASGMKKIRKATKAWTKVEPEYPAK